MAAATPSLFCLNLGPPKNMTKEGNQSHTENKVGGNVGVVNIKEENKSYFFLKFGIFVEICDPFLHVFNFQ